jgi:hypothetical protein
MDNVAAKWLLPAAKVAFLCQSHLQQSSRLGGVYGAGDAGGTERELGALYSVETCVVKRGVCMLRSISA